MQDQEQTFTEGYSWEKKYTLEEVLAGQESEDKLLEQQKDEQRKRRQR